MKLAQALKKRKSLRELIPALAAQAARDAYTATAAPSATMAKVISASAALNHLSAAICEANSTVKVKTRFGELSLLQAKTIRDELVKTAAALECVAGLPSERVTKGGSTYDDQSRRVTMPDTVTPAVLDLALARAHLNQAAKDARDLDAILQEHNWTVEIAGSAE